VENDLERYGILWVFATMYRLDSSLSYSAHFIPCWPTSFIVISSSQETNSNHRQVIEQSLDDLHHQEIEIFIIKSH